MLLFGTFFFKKNDIIVGKANFIGRVFCAMLYVGKKKGV